jgi:hypothetical protein
MIPKIGYRFSEKIMLHLDAAELSAVIAGFGSVSDQYSSR